VNSKWDNERRIYVATYLIGYDLNRPGQSYPELLEAIKGLTDTWWHHLDSTWIIKHDGPATVIRDILRPHIDANDELLVVKLTGEGAWAGFKEQGSAWLKNNL
jgi:hypothetical protein